MSELNERCTALLILAIALAAGNFLWQAMTHKNWEVAIERTYFQTVALLVVYTAVSEMDVQRERDNPLAGLL